MVQVDEKKLKERIIEVLKEFELEQSEMFIHVKGEEENPYITILFDTLPVKEKI